jgi:hypothetical protein
MCGCKLSFYWDGVFFSHFILFRLELLSNEIFDCLITSAAVPGIPLRRIEGNNLIHLCGSVIFFTLSLSLSLFDSLSTTMEVVIFFVVVGAVLKFLFDQLILCVFATGTSGLECAWNWMPKIALCNLAFLIVFLWFFEIEWQGDGVCCLLKLVASGCYVF